MLTPRELRLLDGLRLNPRKSFPGRVRGERLTSRKGISIEFADFRNYSEGDDLRHLDWNVLARLDSAVMRTYRDEEDLALHLLLDRSASMSFGEPTKRETAIRLAEAMAYVALMGGDAVYPRDAGPRARSESAIRGRAGYSRVVRWCDPEREGPAGLARGLKEFAASGGRAGLVAIVSDGLDPELPAAIRVLAGRGHEVLLLQVLSTVEIDPDLEGDLRLQDPEGGPPVDITANGAVIGEYKRRLAEHNSALADALRRGGGRYALVRTDQPLDDVLRNVLKRDGWFA
jgi:uncharacterized protein (DUF58 family)